MEENIIEKKEQNSQQQIAGAIIMAGIIIAGAILLKGNSSLIKNEPPENNSENLATMQGRPVSVDDHILGNPNSKVIILEYSDLECPYCKVFHNTMHRVINDSKAEVAWVYRHYPIPQLHEKAFHEAEATECAWEQGANEAFWKFTDRVFEITPSNDGLEVTELSNIAQYAGLNVESFNACLGSGKFKSKVQIDIDDGIKAGVNGTPSSFILVDGKLIETIPGAQPYEAIMKRLSEIK